MNKKTFEFPTGTQIPIGVANTAIDPLGRYQAGGFELLGGAGGVCTDCHAGENPYITHPKSNLGGGIFWEDPRNVQGLPTFAPNRYDPLVPAAWPQNDLSQAGSTVPGVCSACHLKGSAGRFPHLSNQLQGYCGTILPQAYMCGLCRRRRPATRGASRLRVQPSRAHGVTTLPIHLRRIWETRTSPAPTASTMIFTPRVNSRP